MVAALEIDIVIFDWAFDKDDGVSVYLGKEETKVKEIYLPECMMLNVSLCFEVRTV